MKQTAVEWLYDNLLFAPISRQDVKYNERKFEQAKEMEKEQIIEAFDKGDVSIYGIEINGEQYYKETFNK